MYLLYIVPLLAGLMLSSTVRPDTPNSKKPLLVTIYYESLCPDCHRLFRHQLLDAWQEIKRNITLDLIPFGKTTATKNGNQWDFVCQHGPAECMANKLHACAIRQSCGKMDTIGCPIKQLTRVIRYINCLNKHPDQLLASDSCANDADLTAKPLVECVNSDNANNILSYHGNRTRMRFGAMMNHVPTVTLDNEVRWRAEDAFKDELCKKRANLCRREN